MRNVHVSRVNTSLIIGLMIGVDAKKAFDSIDHNYMQGVLETYGFGPKSSAVVFFAKTLSWGFGQFFSHWYLYRNRYKCVESETCYEKYHEKKNKHFVFIFFRNKEIYQFRCT